MSCATLAEEDMRPAHRPAPPGDTVAAFTHVDHPFAIEMLRVDGQLLRVGRQAGRGSGIPLLMFNGIGGNIELLGPIP